MKKGILSAGTATMSNSESFDPLRLDGLAVPVALPVVEEDVIELTISEVDRQTADDFCDPQNCLICTALRNRGFNVLAVGTTHATVDDAGWEFEERQGHIALHVDLDAFSAPFYHPSVVGRVIRLRKI